MFFSRTCLPAIAVAQARPPAEQVRRTSEAGGAKRTELGEPLYDEALFLVKCFPLNPTLSHSELEADFDSKPLGDMPHPFFV
ncbi:MAG: hypothetical protein PVH82_04385 [Desulfobacteraceae bacterium]